MSQNKVFHFEVRPELAGLSIKEVVYRFLVEIRNIKISKREVKALIDQGKVHVNSGKAFKSSQILRSQDKILVETPMSFLKSSDEDIKISYELKTEDIVYEDKSIIVVSKPSGLSTGPSLDPKRDHLFAAVKRYRNKQQPQKDNYVGLHHRLDVDTSGLVLFTLKRSANKGVAELFNTRSLAKKYIAIAHSENRAEIPDSWEIKNHLGRASGSEEKRELRMTCVNSGGDLAHSLFRKLKLEDLLRDGVLVFEESWKDKDFALDGYHVLEVKPLTGRTHQIRVHLSEYGIPILGDRFYSAETESLQTRLMLHAYSLQFKHPVNGELLELSSPLRLN